MHADRLLTMRSRLSTAYKGLQALLLREGAIDWRTGQNFDQAIFFDEAVDIHHIFPKAWCELQNIPAKVYDSVVNKTPLSSRTNRIIGSAAPSSYLAKLTAGKQHQNGQLSEPPIDQTKLTMYLETHCIPTQALYTDQFDRFMRERQAKLLALVMKATGHSDSYFPELSEEGEDVPEGVAHDSGLAAVGGE